MQLNKAKIRYPSEKEAVSQVKNTRVSIFSEGYKGEFYYIEVDKLLPFKNQAREIFDEEKLQELAASIKTHGIRQPLTVIASDQKHGCFEIVSGERRYKAAKIAGLEKVPCIIITDQKTADEISIIENIQREDLHPIELKNAYKNLITLGVCKSYQDIAEKVCASKSSVADILALDKLPEQTQNALLNKKIKSREAFRTLLKIPTEDHSKVIEQYLSQKRNNISKIVNLSKSRSLSRKAKVLTVSIYGNELIIEKNKISKLSEEHKLQLKELINTLV